MFFKAVVQAVLLFGSEMWVMSSRMGRDLGGGVQYRADRRIIGRKTQRLLEGSLEYHPFYAEMQEAGSEEVEAYVPRRQNMGTQYIATQPIMDLCEEMVRMPGMWFDKTLWEQEGL